MSARAYGPLHGPKRTCLTPPGPKMPLTGAVLTKAAPARLPTRLSVLPGPAPPTRPGKPMWRQWRPPIPSAPAAPARLPFAVNTAELILHRPGKGPNAPLGQERGCLPPRRLADDVPA